MRSIFFFGETVSGYEVKVLNEREIRAGAGILFFFAMIAFMNAYLLQDFSILKIFIITFLADFIIRVLINPRYAPTLILGRIITRGQKPEYSGAPQKRFAWSIGLLMAATMFGLVVIGNITGPINLAICFACLILLFFETSFGICIGCKLYNIINKDQAKHCPGGACEIRRIEDIQRISLTQILIVVLFIAGIIGISAFLLF